MSPRAYLVPAVLLGGVAAFVGYQVVETSRSTPRPQPQASAAAPVSPQGAADGASPPVIDVNRLGTGSGDVTVRASQRQAPVIDTTSVRSLLRDGAAGTYLHEVLSQQEDALHRWPDRGRPIRVWIDRDNPVPNWNPRYTLMAEQAFGEWQEAGFPLRFDIVLAQTEIDIHIRWVEQFPAENGEMIGIARKVRDQFGWLVSAEITIATRDRRGQPIPAETVAGTARHEIGHALGLGHSSAPTDVMYPESRTPVISAADRKTLHLLYLLPPGRIP